MAANKLGFILQASLKSTSIRSTGIDDSYMFPIYRHLK
jgi:hypothetical protein